MSQRARLGAALERRLTLLAPARGLRFGLAIEVLERFAAGRSLHVLDAGCGDGQLTVTLARRNPTWTLTGIDARDDLLEQGRRAAERAAVANASFEPAELEGDLGASRFDAVVALECLLEIEDDERALRSFAAAVRPGGVLVIQVPEAHWRPVLGGSSPVWREQVRHGYERGPFSGQLADAGLTVLRIEESCHSLVGLAQELRDRTKRAPVSLRALLQPLLDASVMLERRGLTWGAPRALFVVATRPPSVA